MNTESKGLSSRGTFLVNTAREGDVSAALQYGTLDGHTGDVWFPQPPHSDHLLEALMAEASNLKLCVTVGNGSDHVDLAEAAKRHKDVYEVSFCNSISVSQHVVLMILNIQFFGGRTKRPCTEQHLLHPCHARGVVERCQHGCQGRHPLENVVDEAPQLRAIRR